MTYPEYEADLGYLELFRDDGDEAVHLLEPLLAFRLSRAYRASRRLRDQLRIESAGRTRDAQQYLYDGYKRGDPGFNMAANPDRIIGTRGGKTFRGSWHMAQEDGHVYAVDMTHHGRLDWAEVHDRLRASGLHETVRGEPWHHQATTIRGPLPGPFPDGTTEEDDEMTPEMEERFDGLATWVFNGTTMILKRIEELAMQLEGTIPKGDD